MSTTQAPQDTEPTAQREGWWRRQTTTARILVITLPVLVLVLLAAVFTRPSPAPTTPGTGVTPQRANACLGGATDLNTAVQYAQANAPLTGTGAAEFLATVLRWTTTTDTTSAAARAGIAQQLAPAAPAADVAGLSSGVGTMFLSSVPTFEGGYYRIDSASPNAATVTVAGSVTTTSPGSGETRRYLTGTWNLAARNGIWTIKSREKQSWEQLGDADKQANQSAETKETERTGQPFQGAC